MKTIPLFMEDSYLKEMRGEIIAIYPEGANRWQIVLNQTIFYPMGGGQPTDQGVLETADWKGQVYQVLMKNDEIIHYVESLEPPPLHGLVKGTINWDRRYRNMRMHSAAHLIDFALHQLGYSPQRLKPMKAEHGKKAYIIYQGVIEEDFQRVLEEQANHLVRQNLRFSTRFIPYEELHRSVLYVQPGIPQNKPLRILTLETVGSVPDGGTQVHEASEVGTIVITKIEKTSEQTTIHYQLAS